MRLLNIDDGLHFDRLVKYATLTLDCLRFARLCRQSCLTSHKSLELAVKCVEFVTELLVALQGIVETDERIHLRLFRLHQHFFQPLDLARAFLNLHLSLCCRVARVKQNLRKLLLAAGLSLRRSLALLHFGELVELLLGYLRFLDGSFQVCA